MASANQEYIAYSAEYDMEQSMNASSRLEQEP